VTADDVYRWAKFRIYGDPDANEGTEPPRFYRLHSVLAWKRAISHFMPNNNVPWNDVAQVGNPTRSPAMSRLTRAMRRFQTQRRGVASKVRRPLTPKEYESIIECLWKLENKELGLCGAAFFTFQFSMIGRVDDAAKFREADLKAYPPFPDYGITARLPWSKNVTDERDAPQQVLCGAMDTRFDPLSNMALWLEYHYELNPGQNAFIFGYEGLDDPIRIKETIRRVLNEVLRGNEFSVATVGLLGTHSTRKFAVTFARGNGCSKVR
jgi:hypothetical protein